MFTVRVSYALLWLGISLAELMIIVLIKSADKKSRIISRVLSIAFMLTLLFNTLASGLIMLKANDKEIEAADYLLVLGYQLENNQMTETLKLRLDEAKDYIEANPNTKVILCGGITRNNTISEANVMKQYLVNEGIDVSRLILEDESTDTIENIKNAKNLIEGGDKIVVISSNYHIYRAKEICRQAGLMVKGKGASAPYGLIMNQLLFEKLGLLNLLTKK